MLQSNVVDICSVLFSPTRQGLESAEGHAQTCFNQASLGVHIRRTGTQLPYHQPIFTSHDFWTNRFRAPELHVGTELFRELQQVRTLLTRSEAAYFISGLLYAQVYCLIL